VVKDGRWFCRLCYKVNDESHEGSQTHKAKANWYADNLWNLDKRDEEYEQWQEKREQARRELSRRDVMASWCSGQQVALPPHPGMSQYAQEHAAAAPAAAAAAAAAAAPAVAAAAAAAAAPAVAAAAAPPSAATSQLPGAAAPSAATFAARSRLPGAAAPSAAHELQQLERRLAEAEIAIRGLAELVRAQGQEIAQWRRTKGGPPGVLCIAESTRADHSAAS